MYINYVNNIPEYTVTQLNRSIKELLEEKFDYIKLIGESGPITIANSGHVYFSIKENDEVISCICWKGTYERLEINLEEGTEYNFFGRVTSYSKFGRSVYQLIIDQVEYSGDGSILKLIENRKKDLLYSVKNELNIDSETSLLPQSDLNEMELENFPSIEEQTEKIEQTKKQRESFGSVNLRADEETKKYETEIKKMEDDRADLYSAIVKLKTSIDELNQKGRERLLEAYTKVNRKFNEVYTKLFNGGTAKIELVDSDDPLEAGLEMFVSPPGKRLQSITLLSGGEQALTALSLVFAVFLVNPSPICVLDEVDAPLDDANVTRFCGLLDDLTKITNTKFIIITHHALTMSRMDRLYGVTMAEQGVSQLVSVDLQKAEELVA